MTSDTIGTARARIALIQLADENHDELTDLLQSAGYDVTSAHSSSPVDMAIIDIRELTLTVRRASALADTIRKTSPEATLLFVLDREAMREQSVTLKRFGEVIPADHQLDHLIPRIQTILRIRNIAEEAGERLKTLTGLNRAVDFPVISTDGSPPRVLIIGTPGPAAIATINIISKVADMCACVLTPGQAMRALDHQTFDVALFLPTERNGAITALIRALRRHPKYARIALIQIIARDARMPNLAGCGGADFILETQIAQDLAQKIQTAARRARLIHSMRSFLTACSGEGVRDKASGIFTPTFLGQHGARLISRSEQTERPLSLVIARLSSKSPSQITTSTKALKKAASLLGRITRTEDMSARISRDTFLALLPDTNGEDAERIALRIEGVLSNTSFQPDVRSKPEPLHVEVSIHQHEKGEAISEAIAKAIVQLPARSTFTQPQQQSPQ